MPLQFDAPSSDTADNQEKSLLQPRPFPAASIRLKLIMLVAMLGLVIVAMNEAGKPENWAWMGFETPELEIEVNADRVPDNQPKTKRSPRSKPGKADAKTNSPSLDRPITPKSTKSFSIVGSEDTNPSASLLNRNKIDYPQAAAKFWNQTLPGLKADSRQQILRWTQQLRTGKTQANKTTHSAAVLRQLIKLRDQYHQQLFDQLTLIPAQHPDKRTASEAYYDSESLWREQILPALSAAAKGEDITMAQQQSILRLQSVLDRIIADQVKDQTTIGWVGDSNAWIRFWERVLSENAPEPTEVQRIQLMSQPQYYRGQWVELAGWIRAVKKVQLKENSATGLPCYYELWLRPSDTNVGPICVCSATLPAGLVKDPDSVTDDFQSANYKVSLSGIFFKVRKFVNNGKQVEYSPVVICKDLAALTQPTTPVDSKNDASSATNPPWLIPTVIGLPVIAVLLAWGMFRSADFRSHTPGERTQQRIGKSLNALKDDPDIQTDLERVIKLEQAERDASS